MKKHINAKIPPAQKSWCGVWIQEK